MCVSTGEISMNPHGLNVLTSLVFTTSLLAPGGLLPAQTERVELISIGDQLHFFRGNEIPPVDWIERIFDDDGWQMGSTPIGYGEGPPKISLGTTVTDMSGLYFTLYVRMKFQIDDPQLVSTLRLIARYDDGFVAYVNGQEMYRASMPAGTATKDTAATSHEFDTAPAQKLVMTEDLAGLNLVAGQNVLAIETHNTSLTSSDLIMEPRLSVELIAAPQPEFIRGADCDNAPDLDIGDPIYLLRWRFGSFYDESGCVKSCDMNDDAILDLADVVFGLNYLFQAGAPFPAPYPEKGVDPTEDVLTCLSGDQEL